MEPEGQQPLPLPGAILFVCTQNIIRSPMAAALFKKLVGNRSYIQSAGVRTAEPDPFVTAVCAEIDIDLSAHQPQTIASLYDSLFDVIITLSPEAHHQALELTRTMAVEVEYWPTLDPTLTQGNRDQRLEAYRACRDGLLAKIYERFDLKP